MSIYYPPKKNLISGECIKDNVVGGEYVIHKNVKEICFFVKIYDSQVVGGEYVCKTCQR